MAKHHFYIVDVFAEKKYTGNQLAVFRSSGGLSTDKMQAITREMHFSETTFIMSEEQTDAGYDVRIFTPGEEIPFAGHPTLGTAFVIREELVSQPVDEVVLNLKIGRIPVTFEDNGDNSILWMRQVTPEFGKVLDVEKLSGVLGLQARDIDTRFPIQEVSTGLPHIIVPLTGLDALKRALVSAENYSQLIKNTRAKAIMIFCPEGYTDQYDLSVRMFADYYGVPEDPATGSGNGCLAGYLIKNRYFGTDSINIRTAQGFEINRPSQLFLKAAARGEDIEVSVGGQVIKVAEGDFV